MGSLRPLGFGELLDSGFAIYRQGFLRFVGIAAVAQVPSLLLSGLSSTLFPVRGMANALSLAVDMAAAVASTVLVSAMMGAVMLYAASFFGFGESDVWRAYRRSFEHIGRIVGFTVLFGLLVGIGFLLLIVPGVLFGVWYSLGLPAILFEERTIWQAFVRSRQLASGAFWRILGVFTLTFLITAIAAGIIQAVFGGYRLIQGAHGVGFVSTYQWLSVGSLIANIIVVSLWEIMATVLYVDQRLRREGDFLPLQR